VIDTFNGEQAMSNEMTPEQATQALTDMGAAFRGAEPSATPTTPAEANARLASLSTNKEWRDKYFGGNVEARREFSTLTEMAAAADDRIDSVMAGNTEAPLMELTTDEHPLTTRDLASAVEGLRESGLTDEIIRELFSGRKVSAEEQRLVEQFKVKRTSDAAWRQRLLSGDHEANRELTLMSMILSSEVEGVA
jgi:hypothetical protein